MPTPAQFHIILFNNQKSKNSIWDNQDQMPGLSANPLLNLNASPHNFPNFRKIKPAHFLPALKETISASRKAVNKIRNSKEPPTFENTIEPLEAVTAAVKKITNYFYFYCECINGNKLKADAPQILKMSQSFSGSIFSNNALSQRVLTLYNKIGSGTFTEAQEELIKHHLKRFEQDGAMLSPYKKRTLNFLKTRLSQLGTEFSMNTLKYSNQELMTANEPLIKEILDLRYKTARLLGYENYAVMANADLMAETPAKAAETIKNYYESLIALHTAMLPEMAGVSSPIENAHEYFPLDQVFDGAIRATENFFKVRFVKTEQKYPVHHPSVHIYEVHSAGTNKLLGLFGADLYRHEGEEKNGTVSFQMRAREYRDGKLTLPISYACFAFDYPKSGEPVLLDLNKYLEIFHELGHCMHTLTTIGEHPSTNGVEVKNDFSETQSQFMEHIGQQTDVMQSIAHHFKTGEPLPETKIKELLRYYLFESLEDRFYRCFQAMLDLSIYNCDPATIGDLLTFENNIAQKLGLPQSSSDNYNLPNFWHMFADASAYAASYHSYLNSEIMAADLYQEYEARKKAGPDVATAFKKAVCSKLYALGGTRAPGLIYQDIMGRPPNLRALFRLSATNDNQIEETGLQINGPKPQVPPAP